MLVGFPNASHEAKFGDTKVIKTRFLISGCSWLVVETTHCVLIISLCILDILGEHKEEDCISTGKRSGVCAWGGVAGGRLGRERDKRWLH